MKTCTKCQVAKPLDQFNNAKRNPDGKCYTCKACNKNRRLDQLRVAPKKKDTEAWANNIINQLSGNDY